jgi:hypothetical protein
MALRVPLFTVATVGLGILAHLAGGGGPPGLATLLLMLAAVALLWKVAARTEQSLLRLLGVMVWVQLGIHLALSQASLGSSAGQSDCSTMTAMASGGSGAAGGTTAMPAGHAMHGSLWMWVAHGAAALLVAAWLRRGEAACWRALRRVVARLAPPVRALPVLEPNLKSWVDDAGDARPDPAPALLGHRWRGPPMVLLIGAVRPS